MNFCFIVNPNSGVKKSLDIFKQVENQFKKHGITNTQVLKVIIITAAFIALFINIVFYNISSNLKGLRPYYYVNQMKRSAS